MTLAPGAKLGPYEVLSAIGAGGMGEVYKARDTRLDRAVAIKLLRPEFAERSDRRERFRREARAISTLSHPNICTLFDVGEDGDRAFLVMEYLEGETLDDRLARGPLRASDVLLYAEQIADALDHAHKQGITHRDLKPSNVMLTPAGAKLLDFGLARGAVLEPAHTSETQTFDNHKLTAEGTLLGTVQYMAPEQLEGQDTDARTDIFAFGMLVYEMATARKAFEGGSPASLIAAILTGQTPVVSTSRPGSHAEALPPALDHFVERCLSKRAEDRWQTARDVKLELQWIGRNRSGELAAIRSRRQISRRELVAWCLAVLTAASAVGLLVWMPDGGSRALLRFTLDLPPGATVALSNNRSLVAVSPDGRRVAFVASKDARQQVWIQDLSSLAARALPGTDGAFSPFWSHDSRSVGFFAQGPGEIRVTSADGGPVRTVCKAKLDGGATWSRDGIILFTQLSEGIYRVPAEGGTPQPVTTLDKAQRELSHYWPALLPDGRRFLYMATALDERGVRTISTIYAASLDGGARTFVTRMNSKVVYAEPGFLLFVQDGTLQAQTFNASTLHLSGEPQAIADGVAYQRTLGNAAFSVSMNGVIAYQSNPSPYQLVWYDRNSTATPLDWPPEGFGTLRLSPDERSIAADVRDPRAGTTDILLYDVTRGAPTKFTSDANFNESFPVWSPDGQIAFRDDRSSAPAIFSRTMDGLEKLLLPGSGPLTPEDWSRDGKWIIYRDNPRLTDSDLLLLPTTGDPTPRRFMNTPAEEWGGRFSPNSRWVAFVSTEFGQPEVFVAQVPTALGRTRISVGGGLAPRWRGNVLYYVAANHKTIMRVPITAESTVTAGTPVPVFTLPIEPAPTSFRELAFDVTEKGDRFLAAVPAVEPVTSRIGVVMNWMAALTRK